MYTIFLQNTIVSSFSSDIINTLPLLKAISVVLRSSIFAAISEAMEVLVDVASVDD